MRARRPTRFADPADLVERAAALTDGALRCREHSSHDWQPYTVSREGAGFHRVEKCSGCGSERRQDLDSRALVVKTSIAYSEGYLNPPGTGRADAAGKAVYRLELLTRQLARPQRRRRAS